MRAIRIHGFGGIDTMRLDEIPRPVPGAGEVLVAVKAAGVGLWDRLMREGGISQALPWTLGSEVSGTVAALGAGVGAFALGDAIYGATNDQFVGGYAEYALVEAGATQMAMEAGASVYGTARARDLGTRRCGQRDPGGRRRRRWRPSPQTRPASSAASRSPASTSART